MRDPYVVRTPAVSIRSLTSSRRPCNGPDSAAAGSTVVMMALYGSLTARRPPLRPRRGRPGSQPAHLDERAGWPRRSEDLLPDRVHRHAVVDVREEHRHLDDVAEPGPRSLEHERDVPEHLLRLRDDVAGDEVPVRVDRDTPRHEQEVSGQDRVGVMADRLWQSRDAELSPFAHVPARMALSVVRGLIASGSMRRWSRPACRRRARARAPWRTRGALDGRAVCAEGARECREVRGCEIGPDHPPGEQELLVHADRPVGVIVENECDDRQIVLHGGLQLLARHQETAVAREADRARGVRAPWPRLLQARHSPSRRSSVQAGSGSLWKRQNRCTHTVWLPAPLQTIASGTRARVACATHSPRSTSPAIGSCRCHAS